MKLAVFVAALLGLTVAPAAEASLHLRVHILTEKAGLNQQCEWEDKAVKCDTGMFCQMKEKHFGWCMKTKPVLNDQCGGKGTDGPWAVPCSGSNLKCVLVSDQYSKCQKKTDREKLKMPTPRHHHKGADGGVEEQKVALYGRCKFEDGSKSCASGLQCVQDSDWSGSCMKKEAGLYDQCAGQEIRGLWKASCPKGALCRESDTFYSQCLPEAVSKAMDAVALLPLDQLLPRQFEVANIDHDTDGLVKAFKMDPTVNLTELLSTVFHGNYRMMKRTDGVLELTGV